MRDKDLKSNNIAAVMVTAVLPPFAKAGSKLDVMVSSVGDAKGLLGGTLLMTPLRGADSEVYAVAQGAVVIGGFVAGANSASGSVSGKNHHRRLHHQRGPHREGAQYDFMKTRRLTVNLYQPDFTTLTRLASTVNSRIGDVDVKLVDSGSAVIEVKNSFTGEHREPAVRDREPRRLRRHAGRRRAQREDGHRRHGEKRPDFHDRRGPREPQLPDREDFNVSQPLPFAPAARAAPSTRAGA